MSARLSLAMSATALVVALLGSTPLGHALASQVPRNSVGPLQIKRNAVGPQKIAPNAVRTGHVLDGSLLTVDFKAGQIPQGPKGERGEKGERGGKGDQGAPGISERQVISTTTALNSTSPKFLEANCPPGKQPLGGGASVDFFLAAALTRSTPTGTGWAATAHEAVASTSPWSLQLSLICAKVSP